MRKKIHDVPKRFGICTIIIHPDKVWHVNQKKTEQKKQKIKISKIEGAKLLGAKLMNLR